MRSAGLFGNQSIVASIDAKKVKEGYKCVVEDGHEIIDITPVELAKRAETLGAGEIIINSVDQDGMMQGYDLDLISGRIEKKRQISKKICT